MAHAPIRMSLAKTMNHVTLNVEIVDAKSYGLRMKLSAALIRLAAWIMGCKVRIEMVEDF